MKIKMLPDTAEGLLHELNFLLAPTWTLHLEVDRLRISPAEDMRTDNKKQIKLHAEVWRIARFVA